MDAFAAALTKCIGEQAVWALSLTMRDIKFEVMDG